MPGENETAIETPTETATASASAEAEASFPSLADTGDDEGDAALDQALESAGFEDDESPLSLADDTRDDGGEAAETPAEDGATGDAPEGEAAAAAEQVGSSEIMMAGVAALAKAGLSSEVVKGLAASNPELILKAGRAAAVEAEAEAGGEQPDQAGEAGNEDATDQGTEAQPVPPSDDALAEILGESWDSQESGTLQKLAAHVEARAEARAKQIVAESVPDNSGLSGQLQALNAAVSEIMGRQVAARLADTYPELSTDEGYTRLHKRGVQMRQAGVGGSIDELLELAAVAEFGASAQGDIKRHREKVNRAKGSGSPTEAGRTAGAEASDPGEDEWDQIWSKSQK